MITKSKLLILTTIIISFVLISEAKGGGPSHGGGSGHGGRGRISRIIAAQQE
ncbi:hypothetical protein OROGR_027654 [Orobanche gracilis]